MPADDDSTVPPRPTMPAPPQDPAIESIESIDEQPWYRAHGEVVVSVWLPVLAAVVPLIVAAVRAAAGSWVPIGDNAYFTVRSRDVLTDDHPLLGAWSSSSIDVSDQVNNVGPLQFDVMAPFTRWTPMGGTAVAVVVVHIASIVTIAWLVRRMGGDRMVLPAMAGACALTWTMGSEMLITPQQHQFLVIPFLCLLVAAWSFAAGDQWALVVIVAAGSLLTQTHLTYPILVASVVVASAVVYFVGVRIGRVGMPSARPWYVVALAAVVLWAQSLYDQFFGWGNLGAVLTSSGSTGSSGFDDGVRVVASVLASPTRLVRPGFGAWDPSIDLAGTAGLVMFGLLIAVIVGILVFAVRHHHFTATGGLVCALVAIAAGVVNAAMLPVTMFGLAASNYRWLWSVAAFVVIGTAMAAVTYRPTRFATAITVALGSVVAVSAIANLPTSYQVPRSDVYLARQAQVADMAAQLSVAEIDVDGPVLFDASRMYFGHPFSYPAMVVLQDLDVDFRFDDPVNRRRLGDGRVADGTEQARLVFWHGDEAREQLDMSDRLLAFVDAADPMAITLETP